MIEIRKAYQEDHDDLSVIFEANSKEIKETYGEFFLAELIKKCQDDNNKALVAQYVDRVLGFISISNEIDLSVLYKCFELEQFDYLLKPSFVDLMKQRRVEIEEINKEKKAQEDAAFKQKIENEKVLSHRIANTNLFQIFLTSHQSVFMNALSEYSKETENKEKKKDEDSSIGYNQNRAQKQFKK